MTPRDLDAYQAELDEALRGLTHPAAIQATAVRILGERLGAERVLYSDIDSDGSAIVNENYVRGVPKLLGRIPTRGFGRVLDILSAGETLVIRNVNQDPRIDANERGAFAELGVVAVISVPLIRDRRWVSGLSVHLASPRDWTPDDVAFVEATARRTWAAVEQALAERALRESEENYRNLFESIDQGFCVIEVLFDKAGLVADDFRFLKVSPSFATQTGITDAVGRRMREIAPAYQGAWFEQVARVARTGETARFETWVEDLKRWYDVCAFRVDHPAYHRVGVLLDDVTRRKTFAAELEREVEARTHELTRSQEQLRKLATELNLAEQRERKRLAGELHDHLQQLLVVGKLKVGQARRKAGAESPLGELILEMDDLLSESLKYTRTLVAELSPPILREHGLAARLRWLADSMQNHNMTVTVTASEGDGPQLPEDQATLLFQSVRELLINASKYSGSREAFVALEATPELLRVEVRDEGVGFDVPGVTGQAAHGAPSDSSRFGLFSIRERMRALGGTFEISSELGKGTTAVLVLPLESSGVREVLEPIRKTAATARPPRRARAPRLLPVESEASRRVLLVDDHAMVRQGLRRVLESYPDVQVVGEASDGEEAVAAVDHLTPDVVVMDISMPKMSGIQATAVIKSCHPEITIIGLSVNAGGENRSAMLKAGAAQLLTKEAAVEQLYDAIQEHARVR